MPTILLLTGPGGSGKSTIAKLLEEKCGFTYLDGDMEDTEFFPHGDQWTPENAVHLKKAHEKIVKKSRDLIDNGKDVVIDYIIFGHYVAFIESLKKTFTKDFHIKVLFPSENELLKRDVRRECWTTGADRIRTVYKEFEAIKDSIGSENFLDTSGQSPEETFAMYFSEYT